MASILRPAHLSSTSRALFRVFVAPTLTTPLLRTSPFPPSLLPVTSIRPKSFKKDTPQRQPLSDSFVFDAAITAPYINLVDLDGLFHPSIDKRMATHYYDEETHHLLQVSPGRVDEYGAPHPSHPPTCKPISKMELRAQHKRKLDIERRQARGQGAGPPAKSLELNWAIAPGDLKHRIKKMVEFLKEGRKVEVLFGKKARGKQASEGECRELLKVVREEVRGCRGAAEVKEAEGTLGGVMTLVFEGRKLEDKAKKGEDEGKEKEGAEEKDVEKEVEGTPEKAIEVDPAH
ncbi:hypothetical protein BDV95DRAFT_550866 [Massariosphaeria phaeospora]|uniref:Translation initiation factor IF-3, C-terminal domain-containing protein n=1 Tax=Massariosphaeria phaeospora TaxID=100035 RepID=A0A7C8I0U9_9PLEO|nr:hypothetical protein BDV95DRAFT_550866 [Massariosphaeria phaeospora]